LGNYAVRDARFQRLANRQEVHQAPVSGRLFFCEGGFIYNRVRREPLSGVKVVPEPFEHIDATLRRFKKVVQSSGILTAARNRQHFITKGERRRVKSINARKKRAK
jgi:ribosomal protein S21